MEENHENNNVLEYRFGDTTTCGLCLGLNRCYVLAPKKGDLDRKRWPEDFQQAYWEDFTGIEIVDCPRCSGKKRSPEETTRIINLNP